ncbi:uncharacterized protein LOC103524116 [Trichonephila clavipes]|nr:uncharacterized protein LOC103524116 [Trichonephila clavipes]
MDISNSFNSFYSTKQRLKKSLKTRQKIIGREIRNIASSQSHGHEIFHRNFSISELREAVGHIRCAKSPGPDNFHPEFLKHLGCNALSVLLTLYNHSWKYGVPAIWKKAIVVPIPKKNKPLDDLNSYRPISLTSILSKVMERMITSQLDWYLETNNLLTSSQAALENELPQRFSAVRFGNAISSFKQSETGLPQGTVISPILFNIFINDLPDLLASDGLTNTALFADDLTIWCSTPKRDQSKLNTILNLTLERLHLCCIENNMTVNLKKTTCQFFTLNRQPFSPQLVYNGMPVQQSDVSIYLGCALDNKLKWTKHVELVVSKARKRLSILKRLTGVKWGCNRDTLNTTYKTYIQPVLNYCNEVLISASENVRKLHDTFHNQALRMITGGVKTTPVLAMQLLCDLQPFTNIIEKNAAILFNRVIRLPNNSFWRDYDSDGGLINDVPFILLSFANPLDYATLDIRLDLVLNVRKRDLSPTALHAIALETINTRFPPEEWLHIYTDGSLLDFAQGAGIGVFSHLFSFYLHASPLTTHFDGEVEAIHIALQQLAVRVPPIERAVIFSDSTSALQALSNYNENNCLRVQNCRELLGKIKGNIVFQWVPSHCGLWGNERADFLAKKGTGILQNFRRDLTLHSAKLEIKRIFRESFRLATSRVARDKPWSTLCKKSHGIPSSPRAAAVAKFRLLTGHDCLCAHLFRFNLVTSPICVLCNTGQDMTAAHLDECSELNDLN